MITKQQILEANTEEFALLAAMILREKPWKHSNIASSHQISENCKRGEFDSAQMFAQHHCDDCTLLCRKCNERVSWYEHCNGSCTVPDSINLEDGNEAYKWRTWAVEKFGVYEFCRALRTVYSLEKPKSAWEFDYWGIALFQNIHHIKAACLCAVEEE